MITKQPNLTIDGICHCGNLGFAFATACAAGNLVIRACQCSFCRAHGAATARDPEGDVRIRARDPTRIKLYRFGTRTTDFVLCAECGVYLGAVLTHAGRRYATLNMRLTSLNLSAAQPIVYDDESPEARVARRIELFTPVSECPF